jgi:hypothetical protein
MRCWHCRCMCRRYMGLRSWRTVDGRDGAKQHTSPDRKWWKHTRICRPAGWLESYCGTTSTLWSASIPRDPPSVEVVPVTPHAYQTYPCRFPGGRSGRRKTQPSDSLSSISTLSSFPSAGSSHRLPHAARAPALNKLSPGCRSSASLLLQLLKIRCTTTCRRIAQRGQSARVRYPGTAMKLRPLA